MVLDLKLINDSIEDFEESMYGVLDENLFDIHDDFISTLIEEYSYEKSFDDFY